MRPPSLSRRSFVVGLGALAVACEHRAAASPQVDSDIEPALLVDPAPLAARVADIQSGTLRVFHVGPLPPYTHGHVPGAVRLGDARTDEGYAAWIAELRRAPASVDVVAYCGCCPLDHCPNVHPAARAIREVRRPRAWVLRLPINFDRD